MILKIIGQNFESHEYTEIDFTENFNLLVGRSNHGKSSIVRMIALVAANEFEKEQVRTGADFCSVQIFTEKGSVKAERGESRNHWEIIDSTGTKKEYNNIGTTVPPEVLTILGIGERVRGDIKDIPNIMFQLEKHFMLSEVNGQKATSNVIARMMDEAIGIGGMEELIKDIATDFARHKKELSEVGTEISEIKSEILEESIYNDYKSGVEGVRKLMDEVDSNNELISASESLFERLEQVKNKKNLVSLRLSLTEGINELSQNVELNISKLKILEKIKTNRALHSVLESRIKVDIGSLDSELLKVQLEKEKIEKAESMLKKARELYKKIRGKKSEFAVLEKNIKQKEEEFEALKKELKDCPLCGGTL